MFFYGWLVYYALQGNICDGVQKNGGGLAIIGHRRGEQVLMGQKGGGMFVYLNHNSNISGSRTFLDLP